MKTKKTYFMLLIGVALLTGLVFSQQQTITYENFPKAKMMLIGIPLNFENSDPGAVLGPVFGGGDSVGEWWRFSRWNIGDQTYYRYGEEEYVWDHSTQAYTGSKAEQGSPHDIEPGYGYWLAQSSANTVDNFSLTGTPADQEAPVYVAIDPPETVQGHAYPGISMVSNPFLFDIDWKNACYRINGNREVSLQQAVNMGLVSQYAYLWDGDEYTSYNATNGGNLKVWDGYWVEQLNPEQTEYVVYDVACDIETSEDGGGSGCGTCPDHDIGEMKYLKLRYDGDYSPALVTVYDHRWRKLFKGNVSPGGEFEFYGKQNKQSMGPKIRIYVDNASSKCGCGTFDCEIHTSCSVAIGPGQVWGSFTIMEAISKNDVTLCPVGETNKPIIRFYDAEAGGSEADLGDGGAIETDRFLISLTGDDNDELSFKTFTVANDSSNWIALSEEGTAVSDGLGFTVTLISEDGGDYVIDVASSGSAVLEAVKFRFGDDQTLDSPTCGETYSSLRSLLGGVQVTTLELKTPPIEFGSSPSEEVTYDSKYGGGDKNIKFEHCSDPLGTDGAIETDQFSVGVNAGGGDEVKVKIEVEGNGHGEQVLTAGQSFTYKGFRATFTSVQNNTSYSFTVRSLGTQPNYLKFVEFKEFDNKVTSPGNNETVTITRTTGSKKGGLAKSSSDYYRYPTVALSDNPVEWFVPVSVKDSENRLKDTYNGFGVSLVSSDMFDTEDARNFTPNLDAWVDIYFPHHLENNPLNYWPQNPMKAAYDIRPSADVIAWDFNLAYYKAANQKLTISWDTSQFPAGWELILVDYQNDTRTDMLANAEYMVTTPADDDGTLYYTVVAAEPEGAVGINSERNRATEFRLLPNYPNPFNATTRLQYQLPENARVNLTIYDIKGHLINTLVNSYQNAGLYNLEWNGRDHSGTMVGTGVYLYRLQAGGRTFTRKMLLIK
ncbi:MAG: hypothetical protein DRP96_06145 [Candidatus Neomarinimicrobiota bacterium]|nr:MAG: hypothetical protein DRP96_06145 [Candidatus Neomarinimicrobiota bacterium]